MISDTVIDVIRAALDTTGCSVHVCVLSGTNAGSASITTSNVAVPSRGHFLLYSVTKTIMAVAALRPVQEGRLRLDQDLSPWLPEFPPARDFSLRQILQHTSGLLDYGGLKEYHAAVRRGDVSWTEAEFQTRNRGDPELWSEGIRGRRRPHVL
jgi:D-alanyl-D-alanine carboxypeptidase